MATIWTAGFLLLGFALAQVNDQVNANVDYGTFCNPSSYVRPKFRYWLPDASVDEATVSADIESSTSIGAGGVEFLGFYNYGGELGITPPGADWTVYGFGTPAFQSQFKNALETSKRLGLVMDFPLGPNQGQGVPAEVTDPGLQWDLVPYSSTFSSNFSGTIPGWGSGELVAAVYAEVLSETNHTLTAALTPFAPSIPYYLRLVLQNGSLTDITKDVSSSGELSLNVSPAPAGSYYRLFTYFQKRTLNKALTFTNGSETGTIFENGSFVVDHFSARGAQTTIDFWETYMLTNGVKELLMEVGHCGWEDSIEIISNTSWSPNFPAMFEQKFGYSLLKYLPLIQWENNNLGLLSSNDPGSYDCVLNTPDGGIGYLNDFRALLVEGYRQYLEAFTNWTESMDLQYSAQISYNLPMDMAANIPFANVPECESLAFGDNIDGYRQFTGAAQLAGKRVISNEMGANILEVYQLSIPHLLWSIARAFIAGVNQVVIHGQQFTGDYYDTTWPGYVSFFYLFSEQWSNKQPSWENGFADALNHVARMQFILQQGTPKTDVAMYNKQSATNPNLATLYAQTDLLDAGWTYTYLSPDNFALPEALVKNGALAPDGPAYKAMVVDANYTNVTADSIQTLVSYARAGLPIIFVGGTPGYYKSGSGSDYSAFESTLSALLKMKNVYSVATGGVASKLNSLGLSQNVKVQTNGTWYTSYRDDSKNGVVYVSVYADLSASTGTVEIMASGIPYFLNTWTGDRKPVVAYTKSRHSITIPLNLAGNQTVIIAISNKVFPNMDTPGFSVTFMPSYVTGHSYSTSQGLTVHVTASSSAETLLLSTGKAVNLDATSIAAPFALSNWTLTAEHWTAPSPLSNAAAIAQKSNTTHTLDTLTSWAAIPALANTSGVGYYTASFAWPPTGGASGATIAFPAVLHTLRARLNGAALPPLDLLRPAVDVSALLRDGPNVLEVVVPTRLWNYVRSVFGKLQDAGSPMALLEITGGVLPPPVDEGLVGEMLVVPYRSVVVRP